MWLDARDLELTLSTFKRGSGLSLKGEVRQEVQGILIILGEIIVTEVFFNIHFLYAFLVYGWVFLCDFIYYY